MATKHKLFVVVENAGYEGESDIAVFDRYHEALDFICSHYEPEEQDSLRVAIACESANGDREY